MTKTRRITEILLALIMIGFAIVMFMMPERSLLMIVTILGIGFTLEGFRTLIYYFQMARYMVGGESSLFRGIIFLDLGLFVSSLINTGTFYIVLYIAVGNVLTGVFALMKANETRNLGSGKWILSAAYGAVMIVLSIVIIAGQLFWHNTDITVYAYSAGLLYSALRRLSNAFSRTAIAYIP